MHVVRRQFRIAERCEKRPHLSLRELLPCLDCCLARHGCGKMLVSRCGPCDPVSGQRIETLSQASFGIESSMRHRDGVHDQRVSPESFDLEAESFEILAIRFECISLSRAEMQSQREKQSLSRCSAGFERSHEFLVQHALVRRMLIYQNQAILMLERDVCPSKLKELGNFLLLLRMRSLDAVSIFEKRAMISR